MAYGQVKRIYNPDPDIFVTDFAKDMANVKDDETQAFTKEFVAKWGSGMYSPYEKEALIQRTILMQNKLYKPHPDIYNLFRLFEEVKDEASQVSIPFTDFMQTTDSCIIELERNQVSAYLNFLANFVDSGVCFRTSNAMWRVSANSVPLKFVSRFDENGKWSQYPELKLKNTDIIYTSSVDSNIIYNTTGNLNVLTRDFKGYGGIVGWEKLGLTKEDVYCNLNNYKLDFDYPAIEIDSVEFHYTSLFKEVLMGKYEDRNKGRGDNNVAFFPAFRSYGGGIVIQNLITGVRYAGGFSLRGNTKIGSGYEREVVIMPEKAEEVSSEFDKPEEVEGSEPDPFDKPASPEPIRFIKHEKATLSIYNSLKREVMNLRSDEFFLDSLRLKTVDAEMSMYITPTDSLYHPAMRLTYRVETGDIILIKDPKKKSSRQPIQSSLHEYAMYFETIRWNVNSDTVYFTSLVDKENKLAAVESQDFYNKMRFGQFKGVLKANPIGAMYRYNTRTPGKPFLVDKFLQDAKLMDQKDAFILAIPDLEAFGFIEYDETRREITVLPKTVRWAKAARAKKDYDVIQLVSRITEGDNAFLTINNQRMRYHGVETFSYSDSLFARNIPKDQMVWVLEDRNLEYSGAIGVGKMNLYGDKPSCFKFNYNQFMIKLDSVDSLRFVLVRGGAEMLQNLTAYQWALRNTIFEGVVGAIFLNPPTNKSGLKRYPAYPVFDCYSNSYVYWFKPTIADGVYIKEKLYFAVYPYAIDSLETFTESRVRFNGEFISSEIFPKFAQTLVPMPDSTMGFEQITPEEGYEAYANKGRYYKKIIMDGTGLHGDGRLDYYSTMAESDRFMFYFDTVKCTTRSFRMPEGYINGIYFPEINAGELKYVWYTKNDKIEIETINEPVRFYDSGVFYGKLKITPKGVIGSGTLTMGMASIESDSIDFNTPDIIAPDGTFKVADSDDTTRYLLIATNQMIKYNIRKTRATFETLTGGATNTYFPLNMVKSSLGFGYYDQVSNDVRLSPGKTAKDQNYFYSTNKGMDSLNFKGDNALYRFKEKVLHVTGVPYVDVADSRITPDSNKVSINPDSYMATLLKAKVLADRKTELHNLYESTITITSRFKFAGSGLFDYIKVNDVQQVINFNSIKVIASDTTTVATAIIPDEQQFFITDRIFFRGNAEMVAARKYLRFTGQVKIQSRNPFLADSWFDFDQVVNPDSIFIPIDQAKLGKLSAGLHHNLTSHEFYSLFLQEKRVPNDWDVLQAYGGLTFDRQTREFRIGPKEKFDGQSYRGNIVNYDDSLNIISSQGLLKMPMRFYENTAEFKFAGLWKDEVESHKLRSDIMIGAKFKVIPDKAWDKLAVFFAKYASVNEDVDFSQKLLMESLAEFTDNGNKEKNIITIAKNVKSVIKVEDIKLAEYVDKSFIVSNVNFHKSQDFNSVWAEGKIGLLNIGNKNINKQIKARIEYNYGKENVLVSAVPDTFNIYLEADAETWVYFRFYKEVIQTWSSDFDGFNVALTEEYNRVNKGGTATSGYRFEMLSESDKETFMKRFSARYKWK